MRYLVDTHIALWSLMEPRRLTPGQRLILTGSPAPKLLSVVSLWEISLKYGLGNLVLHNTTPEEVFDSLLDAGYRLLPLDADDAASVWRLPRVADHRDPFDRLLIWQAIRGDLALLSSDRSVDAFCAHGLRLAE